MKAQTWIEIRWLASALLCLAAFDVSLAAPRARWELGIQGGFFLPDKDLSGKSQDFGEVEPTVGLRVDYLFRERWGWFFDAGLDDINSDRGATGDVDTIAGLTGVEHLFRPYDRKALWFVAWGGGLRHYELETGTSFDRAFASVGFGQRVELDDRAHFRWEVRGDQTLEDEGLGGEDLTRVQFLIGISWGLGRIGPVAAPVVDGDADGDGVPDSIDACPGTPRGARVDGRGCPLDSDGDGVFDGLDACPGTPRGARVDGRGCPLDSDGDGVFDGLDACPGTPRGARVDGRGCPLDSDGDGVFDGLDACPGTPRGVRVDATGCRMLIPETPQSAPIRLQVFFDFNRAVLKPESEPDLDRLVRQMRRRPGVSVEIGGHTDSDGPAAYNDRLSLRRAVAVRDYLVGRGIDAERLRVRGYGESSPQVPNDSAANKARNRRVAVRRLD